MGLPEGAIQTGAVEVIMYLDKDGVSRYRVAIDNTAPLSQALGMLELAKHDLIANSDWRPAKPEGE